MNPTNFTHVNSTGASSNYDMQALSQLLDRKEIYTYSFAMSPENPNPCGAVNFSKASQKRLTIEGFALATAATNVEFTCDVFAVHYNYNWVQVKDGRVLLSFS
ncbi:MAG: hypothetical protein SGPRY_011511 [Prymnesium sp.]